MPRITLDRSKLLGFKLDPTAPTNNRLGAKLGSKPGTKNAKFGSKIGGKLGNKAGTKTARA